MPPRPTLVRELLPSDLHAALRLYVRSLVESRSLVWEEWGKRLCRHDDPILSLVHERIRPRVEELVGAPIKSTYVFLASYGEGAVLPEHTDRPQCRYTLDLCLEAGGGEEWPLFVDGEPYVLRENEALLYRGCEQPHRRDVKPEGTVARLAFFHFVDADFDGPLK